MRNVKNYFFLAAFFAAFFGAAFFAAFLGAAFFGAAFFAAFLGAAFLRYWLYNWLWHNFWSWLWCWLKFANARDNFLEALCWQEAWLLACLDLDCLSSERVATFTGFAINFLKFTKIIDHDIFTLGKVASNRVKNDVYSMRCFFLAVVEVWGQRGNELALFIQFPLYLRVNVKQPPN